MQCADKLTVLSFTQRYFYKDLPYALLRSTAVPADIPNHRTIRRFIVVAFEIDHRAETNIYFVKFIVIHEK